MSVKSFEIRSDEPYYGGQAFGAGGSYEQLRGVVGYALDPDAQANERITDLKHAERDRDGLVHFDSDFVILRPRDVSRANGRLLYVVNNRGRAGVVPFSVNTKVTPPTEIDSGDAMLLREGWTIAYSGWQWDVPREPGMIGIRAPEAKIDGKPIEGNLRVDFRSDLPIPHHLLCDSTGLVIFTPYTAADLEQPDAVLTARHSASSTPRVIERSKWRFAREVDGMFVPDADYVWLEGGFEPHIMYEVRYRTSRSPVAGVGFSAPRDFLSFLRYDASNENPLAGAISYMFATGSSQTGRYLRHFVYEGMNTDEEGRKLLDGIFPHISGARRGEFNERYAQPSHIGYTGLSVLPPFSINETPGLYDRQRAKGGVPKTIFTNTAWEYWRADAAWNYIDPLTGLDREENDESRSYLLAGIDHMGANPMKASLPVANPPNPNGYTLLTRAAFSNLVAWVCNNVEPPTSRVPRVADGTAVRREDVLKAFGELPGATLPDPDVLPVTRESDFGPDADFGIAVWPPKEGPELTTYVSAVDDDLNEVAGVHLPELRVPLATFTGWNPVPAPSRALKEFAGSAFPFPVDDAAKSGSGDPRRSIAARYPNRDAYEAELRAAVDEMIGERFLLAIDREEAVQTALKLWDSCTGARAS